MGLWDWFKSKFGKNKTQMLEEGKESRLNPQNDKFLENLLKELGIPEEFIENSGAMHFIQSDLYSIAKEEGFLKEDATNINEFENYEKVSEFVGKIKTSNMIQIENNQITINKKIEKGNSYTRYELGEDNKVRSRTIFVQNEIDDEKGKKDVFYMMNFDAELFNDSQGKAEKKELKEELDYDGIHEQYDWSEDIKQNENKILQYMLYAKNDIPENELEINRTSNNYDIQYGYMFSKNVNINPQKQTKEQFQDNMLRALGIPNKFLQNPQIKQSCLQVLEHMDEIKNLDEAQEYIENVKKEEKITFNENNLFIKQDISKDEETGERKKRVQLFSQEDGQKDFNYRNIDITEGLNDKQQREGKYDITDYIMQEDGKIEEKRKFKEEAIIFDYNSLSKTEDHVDILFDVDMTEEQNQDGQMKAEAFRRKMQQEYEEYEKSQQKERDVLKGLGVNEDLLGDNEVSQNLFQSLLPELSKRNIDLKTQEPEQIALSLQDLPWQIDNNRVLIYQNDEKNGLYGAVEYAVLQNGEIQKTNSQIKEIQNDGKYGYNFSSNSIVTRDGKKIRHVQKTNQKNGSERLSNDRMMIVLNSLTSLPDEEWQVVATNDLTKEKSQGQDRNT